jgi:hypothetical protein
LRSDPAEDTVDALDELAALENFAGTPGAAAANIEAVELAEGLAVGPSQMSAVLLDFAIYLVNSTRVVESSMYLERAAQLAEEGGSPELVALSLLNLANVQMMREPSAAVETLRRGMATMRRSGDRNIVATATVNLVLALLDVGEWHEAAQAVDAASQDPLTGDEPWIDLGALLLAALRGDVDRATAELARLERLRSTEDLQEQGAMALADTYLAMAEGRLVDVLDHTRRVLSLREGLGIGSDSMRLSWPVATRAALELGRLEDADELVAMLDAELPGRLPPVMRAERELVRARLAVARGEERSGQALAEAVETMRLMSPPHLFAQGLLDLAAYLSDAGDGIGAASAVDEAHAIGERLGCRPVLDRAATLSADRLRV